MTVRKTNRPHAEAVIEMLKADPDFAAYSGERDH